LRGYVEILEGSKGIASGTSRDQESAALLPEAFERFVAFLLTTVEAGFEDATCRVDAHDEDGAGESSRLVAEEWCAGEEQGSNPVRLRRSRTDAEGARGFLLGVRGRHFEGDGSTKVRLGGVREFAVTVVHGVETA